MLCPKCNTVNSDSAKFCKSCGTPLEGGSLAYNSMSTDNNKSIFDDNRNLIIIVLTIIFCAVIVVGALMIMNMGDDSSDDAVIDNNEESVVINDSDTSNSDESASSDSLTIQSGSISTGSSLSAKTYCTVYVGSEHAGENVKISVLYSRDGSNLNNGNIVSKTVSSDGYISVTSASAFKYYPDTAYITVYNADGVSEDTLTVNLAIKSGTQSF